MIVDGVGIGSGSQKHIKDNNQKLIVRLLMQHELLAIKEISRLTGLSIVSVSKNMDELLESRVLIADGIEDDVSYGRKPMIYRFNNTYKYIAGIDLGKKKVDISIGNMQNEIVRITAYEIPEDTGGADIINNIIQHLSDMLESQGISNDMLGCIVIANPGIVYDSSGRIRRPAEIAEKWANIPLVKVFADRFLCNVIVMNDIDVSALGFQAVQSPENRHLNYIHVRVDAGIGIGIIINGNLLEGQSASVGEVGFTTQIHEDGSVELVSYESIASLSALVSRLKKLLIGNEGSIIYRKTQGVPDHLTLEVIADAAQTDAFVQQEITHMAGHIAAVALNGMLLLDINTVVLDGGVLLLGDRFLDPFARTIKEHSIPNNDITVVVAEERSATYGCFQVGRNHVIEHDILM